MSWWSKHKRSLVISSISIIGILFLSFIVLVLLGPIIGNKFCTLSDCWGQGLTIYLYDGQKPFRPYKIIVDYPSLTETDTIFCDEDSIITGFYDGRGDYCLPGGAFFEDKLDKPPKQVKVTVIIDGNAVTKTFKPAYSTSQPNGEGCAPICYSATIYFRYDE